MVIKLNLIPPHKKEEIKKSYRSRMLLRWEGELLLIIFLSVAGLVSMDYILKINLFSADYGSSMAAKENSQHKAIDKYDNEIKGMNSLVSKVSKIQSGQLYWSKFLTNFDGKVLPGIEIDNLSTQNYKISLVGKANTRDNLLVLKSNIEKDDCFEAVNLPLSNLVSKENSDFQMDFQIKKECLK
jgi:hypothetical protein